MDFNQESNVNSYNEPIGDELIEQLDALREITKLGPIAYVKVLKARKDAEVLRDFYIKSEPNDIIEVDYSSANDLEYSLRKRALERKVERDWLDYLATENDGYGLSEYADDVLKEHMKSKKQQVRGK